MKVAITANVGAYQSMKFESSEHPNVQDCGRDLIAQMQPLTQFYPTLKTKIDEIKKAYGVS